jgi:glycosyltransferase involved in cell wall biosynthesis
MKRLLVLNFFPSFYPPASGGEQRYHYIYRYLSRYFDITLLSPTYSVLRHEIVPFTEHFREYRVPKTRAHDEAHALLNQQRIGPECSALACALASGSDKAYRNRYRELIDNVDAVILDSPYMIEYDEQFGFDNKPRIFNSYNVEGMLAESMYEGPYKNEYVAYVKSLERRLVRNSQLVCADTQEDKNSFIKLYGCDPNKVILAPNGFEPSDSLGPSPQDPYATPVLDGDFVLFMGSGHPPNAEAARFICHEVAPLFPDVTFAIAGSVCRSLPPAGGNIRSLGYLGDQDRNWVLSNCMVALNPMFSGSGSNLKLADYMAAKAPILTTPFGARGFDLRAGIHAMIAERSGFVAALRIMLADRDLRAMLGRAAHQLAFASYSWSTIVDRIYPDIARVIAVPPRRQFVARRRKVLILNDYSVEERVGGGQVRIFETYRRLAKRFDVTLLCLSGNDRVTRIELAPGFRQIAIPKTPEHLEFEQRINGTYDVSVGDIISALMCHDNQELVRNLILLSQTTDVIICSHPYLVPLLEEVRRPIPVIYEAHNIEQDLKQQLLQEHPCGPELLQAVEVLEKTACAAAETIVCVTQNEEVLFRRRYPHHSHLLIRNGVEIAEVPAVAQAAETGRPVAMFIGSAHTPNVEAVQFIVNHLAPAVPSVDFHIVGTVCDALGLSALSANVFLRGFLNDADKRALMRCAVAGLNPILRGGGSSLKIGDFFAAGTPVISTPFGIRGYELRHEEEVLVAELHQFAAALARLVDNPALRLRIATQAWEYAKTYLDWDRISDIFASALDERIRPVERPNRLLVVTYRYTDPPRGGAEVYLDKVLNELHALGEFEIDIATTTVESIRNRFHFSGVYTSSESDFRAEEPPPFAARLLRFSCTMASDEHLLSIARQLQLCWNGETIGQARRFIDKYPRPLLMGGWYYPEHHGGKDGRWSSAAAEMFCPAGVTSISLTGRAPVETEVSLGIKGRLFARQSVGGDFTLDADFEPESGPVILTLKTSMPYQPEGDIRQLGIYITKIQQKLGDSLLDVPMADDYEAFLRKFYPEEWINSLIDIAMHRSRDIDNLFFESRGPHSMELIQFLQENAYDYNVILVQGIPFSTTVSATKTIKQAGVPLMLLPHFHMEDRYYHWRCYYDCFAAADRVVISPNLTKPFVMDKIGAVSSFIPGGGVDAAEFADLDACRNRFRGIYPDQRPFVLVPGRKVGSKNYRTAIRAVEHANAAGTAVNLVMIGPDEDNLPVESSYVTYLGAQPREVVVGAIASCVCVVNMSESESFGIVLIEAWMCGRTVIANGGCLAFAELVEHGRDGFLCHSEREVASFIEALVNNSSLQQVMGASGRIKASTKYTWAAVASTLQSGLLELATATKAAVVSEEPLLGRP